MPASCSEVRAPPQLPVIVSWSNHREPLVVCWAIAGHEKNAAAANKIISVCWHHCLRCESNSSIKGSALQTASASDRRALQGWRPAVAGLRHLYVDVLAVMDRY